MKKFFWAAVCLVLIMTAGCRAPGEVFHPGVTLKKVTDGSGQTVEVPRRPVRVVSTSYGVDEILLGLMDPGRIRGLSRYAGDGGISFVTEEEVSRTGGRNPGQLESLAEARPDLVIVSSETPEEVTDTLRDMGIPVYRSLNPKSWRDVERKIRGIAAAVSEESRGEAMIRQMEERRASVEKVLSQLPPDREKRVLALSFSTLVGRKGTVFADILRLAHTKNCGASLHVPEGEAVFTKEAVVQADPDVLLLPTWNFNGHQDAERFRRDVMQDPAYASVKAVREGHVIFLADRYRYVTSQHIADSVEAAARAVYPELFAGEEKQG